MLSWTHRSPHLKRNLDRFSRFCTAHGRAPLQIAPLHRRSGPPSNTWFPGPTRVLNSNGISIGAAIFAGLTIDRPPTNQQTDHARPIPSCCLRGGCIYIHTPCPQKRPPPKYNGVWMHTRSIEYSYVCYCCGCYCFVVPTFLLQIVDFEVTVYTVAHWTIMLLCCTRTLKSTQVEQSVSCVRLSLCPDDNFWTKWPLTYIHVFGVLADLGAIYSVSPKTRTWFLIITLANFQNAFTVRFPMKFCTLYSCYMFWNFRLTLSVFLHYLG